MRRLASVKKRKRLFVATVAILAVCTATGFAAHLRALLPSGWHIAPPTGNMVTIGTLPTGIAMSRDGARAFVLETGYQKPALRIIDARSLQTLRTVQLANAFGAPVRDPNDDGVWVGATSSFQDQLAHINTDTGFVDRTVSLPIPFFASALAFSPDGKTLAVAGDLGNRVAFVDVEHGVISALTPVGRHPAAIVYAPDGLRVFVADRAESQIDVIDTKRAVVTSRITVGLHPAALAVDERNLYVADSDDDDITVVSLATRKVVQRARLPFAEQGIVGSSPDAIVLAGDRLYVACGAANAVAVYERSAKGLTAVGALPTGWYPTAIGIATGDALLVADGKGEGSHANPGFRASGQRDYIANNLVGSIRRIDRPSDAALRDGIAAVESLGAPYARRAPPASSIVRPNGPIKHVVYVIKENRTYDQILGDVAEADGDPSLVMFGAEITPNEHALARRFGVFDRFFTDAHVSADGHSWSMGAFANDYLERMWPSNYAHRRPFYDFEDGAEAAVPHAGYLWDAAERAGISYRNYGEFVTAGPSETGVPTSTTHAGLQGHTDFQFPTFDMNLRDVDRYTEWKHEFDEFEAARNLPALEVVRFPRDHTAGTQTGKNTPQAMVADNDQAVGMLVDAVSHSRDWASTAIFVLEDDAQNGADHVDEQRSTFYLVSPYAIGGIVHQHYSTSSVLRTMEIILGLAPLSPYDAGAKPLTEAFRAEADQRGFDYIPARINTNAKNASTAYRASDSNHLSFADADEVDDGTLNDILWGSVMGKTHARPRVGTFRE